MNNELNSGISNYSAVYQTVMEELVCAVQRNELTLTLNHKLCSLTSRCPSLLFISAHCVLGRIHRSPVALCLISD